MTNDFLFTSKGKNDECYTHRYGVEPLLEFLPPFKDKIIWLPFDKEESEFVKVFRENGYNIVNSHIEYGQDFYSYEPENWDLIISNPPFTNKAKIFERAISFNKPFCLLMSLTWLNDRAPKKLFKDIGMQLLMFEDRMDFKNQDKNKINFSSAYFCRDFLPQQIIIRNFKNHIQRGLFE
jgi:hypothetical protein